MCFFIFNPGPVWRVPIPNRYTAKAKLCFCKNNKRRIIMEAYDHRQDPGENGRRIEHFIGENEHLY